MKTQNGYEFVLENNIIYVQPEDVELIKGVVNLKSINVLREKWSFIFMAAVMFVFLMGIVPTSSCKVLAAEDKNSEAAARTINVNGDGEVSVVPDIAHVSLGATTEKSTVAEAQKNNSTTMNNIIEAIKKAGVASDDIKTSNYNISPKYNYEDKTGNSTLVGYTVTSTLSITVKNINSVGSIIDTAITNGANNTNYSDGITFEVSDYQKYYNIALKNAVSNAQIKGQAIADSIGVKLSTPIKITENSSSIPTEYPVFYEKNTNSSAQGLSVQDMTVQKGTYKVKANVSLVYAY